MGRGTPSTAGGELAISSLLNARKADRPRARLAWTDGTKAKRVLHYPHRFHLLGLFEIADGRRSALAAGFVSLRYNLPCARGGHRGLR